MHSNTLRCFMSAPGGGPCNFLECKPNFAEMGPTLVETALLGHSRAEFGQNGQALVESGRSRAEYTQLLFPA